MVCEGLDAFPLRCTPCSQRKGPFRKGKNHFLLIFVSVFKTNNHCSERRAVISAKSPLLGPVLSLPIPGVLPVLICEAGKQRGLTSPKQQIFKIRRDEREKSRWEQLRRRCGTEPGRAASLPAPAPYVNVHRRTDGYVGVLIITTAVQSNPSGDPFSTVLTRRVMISLAIAQGRKAERNLPAPGAPRFSA